MTDTTLDLQVHCHRAIRKRLGHGNFTIGDIDEHIAEHGDFVLAWASVGEFKVYLGGTAAAEQWEGF